MNEPQTTSSADGATCLRTVGIALAVQLVTVFVVGSVAILACDALGVGPRSQLSLRVIGRVLTALPALVLLYGLLFLVVLILAVPALAIVWAAHRHVSGAGARALVAVAMMFGAEWILYRMEWFDVWRWGVPTARYWATVLVPWGLSYCAAGVLIGGELLQLRWSVAASGATR